MPLLDDNMDTHSLQGSNYGFSGKRIDSLGATEYTIVSIAVDASGSVVGFRDDIEACLKEIVRSCQHSPRADNLMMRATTFDNRMTEVHGFRPFSECHVDSYTGTVQPGGMTSLYDAACNAVDSVAQYGHSLTKNDFSVNGIVFVITDGADNTSTATVPMLKEALQRAVTGESLESLVSVLVGVNVSDPTIAKYLADLKDKAGFTQYVELKDASAKTLARLAAFVSKSISAQSQALGTGGPSQSLKF